MGGLALPSLPYLDRGAECNRLVDISPGCNVFCGIDVGVLSVPAYLAYKLCLRLPVFLPYESTHRALLRGVFRIHNHHRDAEEVRLILDE